MLCITEKVIILRSVSLFSEVPDEMLTEIASLLEEIVLTASTPIFEHGDQGDAMYIIVSGRVRVHRGGRTLDELAERTVFGEMAALDPEPRSASVTTITDTYLLRLERAVLRRFMARRPEVVDGIIHILCQHLRARLTDMVEDYQYLQQVARLTAAAAAVEASIYEPESVDEIAERTDALGQLARIFQRMIREVHAREERLKQQVQELRIEIDEARQAKQVAEITESDYFQRLRSQAEMLRNVMEG